MGVLDSFNPVALTQQFCLQGMVKKRRHVLFFAVSVGVTNFIGGLVIYYGLAEIIAPFWERIRAEFFWILPACEIILGILAWAYVVHRRLNRKFSELLANREESPRPAKIPSVHPVGLMALGAFAVLCELPTSLPYFAFLASLLPYHAHVGVLLGILALYNLLFTAPLFVMYILYTRWQEKADRLYAFLKNKLFRYGTILLPILAAIIGVVAIFHASYLLYR
jgi:hypothetical protein